MPAGRFLLLETPLAQDAEIELPFEVAHQARDVLRLGVGGTIRLLDGAGGEYPAEVIEVSRKRVVCGWSRARRGCPIRLCASRSAWGCSRRRSSRSRCRSVPSWAWRRSSRC